MIRRLILLAVLACCALPAPRPAAAAPLLPARALLDSVAAQYRRLAAFHFEGNVHVSVVKRDTLAPPMNLDAPFVYAAVRPGKLRNESRNPYMQTLMVSDGDSLYVSAPLLRQFTVQPAIAVRAGGAGGSEFSRTLDPLLAMAALSTHVRSASDAGRDTIQQAGGPVPVRRVLVEYEPDSTLGAPVLHPRMLWIDESRRLLARDSLTADIQNAQMGALTMIQDTRFVLADVAGGGPDSLYRFSHPPGSQRVSRLGAPGMDPPDLSGRPAAGFSLAGFDGRRVTLAGLRGHVVVLDFWATWCGPCRRWMPIVAKLHRETGVKGVRFYGVNLRESNAQVRAFLTANKLVVPVLFDRDGAVGDKYGAQSIPLTVIIGKDGRIVRTLLGLHPEDDLRAALREAGVAGL